VQFRGIEHAKYRAAKWYAYLMKNPATRHYARAELERLEKQDYFEGVTELARQIYEGRNETNFRRFLVVLYFGIAALIVVALVDIFKLGQLDL